MGLNSNLSSNGSLYALGEVVESKQNQSLIYIHRLECEECSNTCARFQSKNELWFNKQLDVGTRVSVGLPRFQLALITTLAFALPCIISLFILAITQSAGLMLVGLLVAMALVALGFRWLPYLDRLEPEVTVT